MKTRSVESPPFLLFSLTLGLLGLVGLFASTARFGGVGAVDLPAILLLAAIALTMRLNTFTIPPQIVVSLVYTVQLATVLLMGGTVAAWVSVGTFLLALAARHPRGVRPRAFLAVVSFNVGMEALMTLTAGAVYRLERVGGWTATGGLDTLLSVRGLLSILVPAITLKAVNEILMTAGSWLRGITVGEYLAGARRVLLVEAGMLPLALLLALVHTTAGAKGLAVAAVVLIAASVLVKRLSNTRDELHGANLALERRVGELDVLGRVGRDISVSLELNEVFESILKHCSELVDTSNFFIALYDRDTGQIEIPIHAEKSVRLPPNRIRLGEGLTSLVIQRREPVLIRDLFDQEIAELPIKRVVATPLPTRSWLGVPLIAGDQVLGVMTVQDERPGVYDEQTVRVLTTIAAQAAISIRNAQLVQRIIDQARLEQENQDLRLVNQRKNEFVNMVAHQLQAPLTAIIGFSDLVRRMALPNEASDHLLMIHRESRRLSELVEQLLSLSRIRSGRISPVRRRVDLNAIAREVVDSQVLLIRERAVQIEVGLEPKGLLVDADPALLHQVVANLVNNAIKYSPERSTVAIRTERRAPGSGMNESLAILSVRDSGPGVSAQDRERIFEEFYRSPRPETQQVKGSGLGLTIAREIVQIHGGLIGVDPGPSGGSVFYFSLPAAA
jgi:signal transduction histidine kinase